MSDGRKVLRYGYGLPKFWLYNKQDEEILTIDPYNTANLVPIQNFVKSFEYVFDEENDDTCDLTFQFQTVEQLNNPIFQEDVVLKVAWGYLLPNKEEIKSSQRKIAIRTISSTYSKNGIELVLKCTDLVSYLSRVRSNQSSGKDNFADWLQEILNDDYKATITVKGKVVAMSKTHSRPFEVSKDGILVASDNARALIEKVVEFQPTVIKGKSKALTSEIKEKLEGSTEGPAYVDGRDDVINIVVRNFNQQPEHIFSPFAGENEVISFRTNSNLTKVKEDDGETSTVNPETKKVESTNNTVAPLVVDGLNITEEQLEGAFKKVEEVYNYNVANPTNQKPLNNLIFNKRINRNLYASPSNIDGNTRVYTGLKFDDLKWKVNTKSIINLPGFQKLLRKRTLENFMLRKIERKFECTMEIIGDPSVITSRMFFIKGLSERDNGNWYIVKAEHKLDMKSGYITTVTAIKKPVYLGTQYISKETKYVNEGEELKKEDVVETLEERKYQDTMKETNQLDAKGIIKYYKEKEAHDSKKNWDETKNRILKDDINQTTLFNFNTDSKIDTGIINPKPNIENV